MNALFSTPVRRLGIVITAPVWIPLAVVLAGWALVGYWVATMLWCPPIRVASWVLYGDQYVLGKWWWPLDDGSPGYHRHLTEQAQKKLEET